MRYTLPLLTAAAALFFAPAALADTTVSVENGDTLFVRDKASVFDERMDVVVTRTSTAFKITDAVGNMHVKAPCVLSGAAAKCPLTGVTRARLQGGTKNDAITNETDLPATWFGDKGDDELNGGPARDIFQFEPGKDEMDGGDGNGDDVVTYAGADGGVTVSLAPSSAFNDGRANEPDRLVRVEDATGSAFDDKLNGSAFANILSGGAGIDTLRGAAEDDVLDGEAGNDLLFGDAGKDLLKGDLGVDQLDGGADDDDVNGEDGDDVFVGDEGSDKYNGGPGRNTLDYSARADGVIVTLDAGAPNDGGAADNHADDANAIQDLIGTNVADILTGSFGANEIKGLDGDDELHVADNFEDIADCGAGQDGVEFDLGLDLTPNCEIILP
jgi:Ca2+-binding RTX toxin-like protein